MLKRKAFLSQYKRFFFITIIFREIVHINLTSDILETGKYMAKLHLGVMAGVTITGWCNNACVNYFIGLIGAS